MTKRERWSQYVLVAFLTFMLLLLLNRYASGYEATHVIDRTDVVQTQYHKVVSWEWVSYALAVAFILVEIIYWFPKPVLSVLSLLWCLIPFLMGALMYLLSPDWFRIIAQGDKLLQILAEMPLWKNLRLYAIWALFVVEIISIYTLRRGCREGKDVRRISLYREIRRKRIIFMATLLINLLSSTILALSGEFFAMWPWFFFITLLVLPASFGVFKGLWSALLILSFLTSTVVSVYLGVVSTPQSPVADWIAWFRPAMSLFYFWLLLIPLCRVETTVKEKIKSTCLTFSVETLPRIPFRPSSIQPPTTGVTFLNTMLRIGIIVSVKLYNALARSFQIMTNALLATFEKLINLVKKVVVALLNSLITIVFHFTYSVILFPRILRSILEVLVDALENPLRYVILPVPLTGSSTLGANIVVFFSVEYFFFGDKSALLWAILGLALITVGLIGCISLLERVRFGELLERYFEGFASAFAYILVSFCFISWLLVFFAPRFGIHHFKPGILTIGSTVMIGSVWFFTLIRGKWQKPET